MSLKLPTIAVPSKDVTEDMMLVQSLTQPGSNAVPNRALDQSFFVDPKEVTVGQVRLRDPQAQGSENEPYRATFDKATSIAEASGKRLPTKLEYETLLSSTSRSDDINNKPSYASAETVLYKAYVPASRTFRCVRSARPRFLDVDQARR
jgi:hypothetical protein